MYTHQHTVRNWYLCPHIVSVDTMDNTSEERPFDINSNYVIISGVVVVLCIAYFTWTCRRIWQGKMPIVFICCYPWEVSCCGTFPLKSRIHYYETATGKAGHERTRGDDEDILTPGVGQTVNDTEVQSTMFDNIKIASYA